MHVTTLRQKISLILFGFMLTMAIVEITIRFAGFVYLKVQDLQNRKISYGVDEYRILCLGESTTAFGGEFSYPKQLEKLLNECVPGRNFVVINKGVPATNTRNIVSRLHYRLNQYNPHMVITMMGVNDPEHLALINDTLKGQIKKTIRSLRIYKLAQFFSHLIRQRVMTGHGLYLESARYFREERYFQSAEDMFKKAIASSPQDIQAYFALGWFYHELGRYLKAEEIFKKAVEIAPINSAYMNLGKHYADRGLYAQSEIALKKAMELSPDDERLYIELGSNYQAQGEMALAEQAFKDGINVSPGDPEAYLTLARFYQEQTRYPEAEATYKKAMEFSSHEETYIELGWCYHSQGKSEKAQEMFDKAIEINPKSEGPYIESGRYSFEKKDFAKAEAMFKKAISINKNNIWAYSLLSSILRSIGQEKDAVFYDAKKEHLLNKLYLITRNNYRQLKNEVSKRGIKLVCIQYPLRDINDLKAMFDSTVGVTFVDNKRVFEEALKKAPYGEYFRDRFAGDFGHCTCKGNQLLASNIAETIIKEYFKNETAH